MLNNCNEHVPAGLDQASCTRLPTSSARSISARGIPLLVAISLFLEIEE